MPADWPRFFHLEATRERLDSVSEQRS